MVKHPTLESSAIENLQRRCFREDFERLGPSIYRALETWFLGYKKHRDSPVEFLRKKAQRFAREIRNAYPIVLAGTLLGPNRGIKDWIRGLERQIHEEIGSPDWKERIQSLAVFAAALWTGFKLKFNWFQHPRLTRHAYRPPQLGLLAQHWWKALRKDGTAAELSVSVERNLYPRTIWVRFEGVVDSFNAEELCIRIQHSLKQGKGKLVLDLKRLKSFEDHSIQVFSERLERYRSRIHLVPPPVTAVSIADRTRLYQMFEPFPLTIPSPDTMSLS
jgi:hypothetical protein